MTNARFLPDSHLIEFSVYPGGEQKICFIRYEALKEHFGATAENAVAVLLGSLDRIAPVAIHVASRTPPGESVIVEAGDF